MKFRLFCFCLSVWLSGCWNRGGMEHDDYLSGDDDCYYSDRDTLDGIESDEDDVNWVAHQHSPSTKVCFLYLLLLLFALA